MQGGPTRTTHPDQCKTMLACAMCIVGHVPDMAKSKSKCHAIDFDTYAALTSAPYMTSISIILMFCFLLAAVCNGVHPSLLIRGLGSHFPSSSKNLTMSMSLSFTARWRAVVPWGAKMIESQYRKEIGQNCTRPTLIVCPMEGGGTVQAQHLPDH